MKLATRIAVYTFAALAFASVGQAATWYVGPGGTGSGTSAGSPVGSLNAAYQLANAGDEILVLNGSYGEQNIANRPAANSWTSNVTIKPAPGANPVFTDQTQVFGARVTISGFTFDNWFASRAGSTHLVLENSTLKGGTSFNSDYNTIHNNRFVDGVDVDAVRIQGASSLGRPSTGTIFENNYIKNYHRVHPDAHVDAIQIINAVDIVIRNNRISHDGSAAGIILTPTVGPVNNILIENNFMVHGAAGLGNGGRLLNLGDASVHGLTVINNTLYGSVGVNKGPLNNNVVRNNIIARFAPGATADQPIHDHNYIFDSIFNATLHPTEVLAVGAIPSFANFSDIDLHITPANTVNLAFGTTTGAPQYDIDGQFRTTPIWVGADQVGAPIPEPSSATLFAIVLYAFATCRRR